LRSTARLSTNTAQADRHASSTHRSAANLEAAATLITAAVERDASRADFARRWRATVAALLHAFRAPDLGSHLRSGALPWLIESGKEAEARAAFEAGLVSEIRAAVAGPLSGTPPKKNAVVPAEARSDLAIAARSFDQALTTDPAFAEAALHLGRVRLLDGHDADAERALRTAAAGPGLPVRYLATMMLGAIAERQSRYADAETQYRAAMTIFRWGQSAPLALSHLLMRTGREADARETLAAHLRATGGRIVEPLRTYLANPDTDLGPTLDLLRAEVWR
jgi:Tfp pilus assembly protein PilF